MSVIKPNPTTNSNSFLDKILAYIDGLLGTKPPVTADPIAPSPAPVIPTPAPVTVTPPITISPIDPIAPTQPVTITPIAPVSPITPAPTSPVVSPVTPTQPVVTPPPAPDPNVFTSTAFKGTLYYANPTQPALNQSAYMGRYQRADGQSVNIWESMHTIGLTFWSDSCGGSGEFLQWVQLVQWIDSQPYPWTSGGTNKHY